MPPVKDMFRMTVDPEDAPDKATFLRIGDLRMFQCDAAALTLIQRICIEEYNIIIGYCRC